MILLNMYYKNKANSFTLAELDRLKPTTVLIIRKTKKTYKNKNTHCFPPQKINYDI